MSSVGVVVGCSEASAEASEQGAGAGLGRQPGRPGHRGAPVSRRRARPPRGHADAMDGSVPASAASASDAAAQVPERAAQVGRRPAPRPPSTGRHGASVARPRDAVRRRSTSPAGLLPPGLLLWNLPERVLPAHREVASHDPHGRVREQGFEIGVRRQRAVRVQRIGGRHGEVLDPPLRLGRARQGQLDAQCFQAACDDRLRALAVLRPLAEVPDVVSLHQLGQQRRSETGLQRIRRQSQHSLPHLRCQCPGSTSGLAAGNIPSSTCLNTAMRSRSLTLNSIRSSPGSRSASDRT